ncbi:MAG: chloride channel protein [Polyangiaceae bacterium]|nr:chloride channel protein [Polyangiaceae bacterium]
MPDRPRDPLRNSPPILARPDERLVRELPLTVLRSLAAPLRDLELRNAGRTLLLSLAVGTAVGLVACGFVTGLHLVERVFLHEIAGYVPLQAQGEVNMFGAGSPRLLVPWLVVLVPALGGLVTGLLGHFLAPEILGGGGNAYVSAFHQGRNLRRRVMGLKVAATVSTIGTGGSGGREGPTMLIGAAVGNLIGRALRLSDRERRVLLVAGTAGGLAAVFGTPLGAGLLAADVLYRDDFEAESLVPAILSSVTAFSVFRLVFPSGAHVFGVAAAYPFEPRALWLYVPLALVIAVGGHLFLAQLHLVRGLIETMRLPRWTRPAVGGLGLGVVALCWIAFVNPSLGRIDQGIGILGSGYGAAQAAIRSPAWMPPGWRAVLLLGGLAVVKMLATALTLESGGSAGDFAPSIAIGGLLGGAFGHAVGLVLPGAPEPGAFALVGMGAFYGGLAHTPISAVVMVCEMAGSYDLLVPLMLSVGLTYLALRGVWLYPAQRVSRAAAAGESSLLDTLAARDIVVEDRPAVVISANARPTEIRAALGRSMVDAVVVVDASGRVRGVIERRDLDEGMLDPTLEFVVVAADLANPVGAVREADPLSFVLASMMEARSNALPVLDARGQARWLVTEHEVTAAYYEIVAGRRQTIPSAGGATD